MDKSDTLAPKRRRAETERLSPVWALFGCGLFLIALTVPVATVTYFPVTTETTIATDDIASQRILAVTDQPEIPADDKPNNNPMHTRLAEGEIVPGDGIGDLLIGEPVDGMLRTLPIPAYISAETDGRDPHRVFGFTIGAAELEITSQVRGNLVSTLTLIVHDCEALMYYQPRQEGVPSTSDGLSIGSHQSRVISQLGVPIVGAPKAPIPGPMPQAAVQVYPGLELEYCPENKLVRRLTVVAPAETQPDTYEPQIVAFGPSSILSDQNADNVAESLELNINEDAPLITAAAAPASHAAAQPSAPEVDGLAQSNSFPDGDVPVGLLMAPAAIPTSDTPLTQSMASDDVVPKQSIEARNDSADIVRPHGDIGARSLSDNTTGVTPPETTSDVVHPATPSDTPPPTRLDDTQLAQSEPKVESEITTSKASANDAFLRADRVVTDLAWNSEIPDQVVIHPALFVPLAASVEESLALNRTERIVLQRRLQLLGHNPRGVDGIFGPLTRSAISDLQRRESLPDTGYVDIETKSLIEARSRKVYARWLRDVRRRKAKEAALEPVIASTVPPARAAPQCDRDRNGVIIDNQSFSCDVTVLQEGFETLIEFASNFGA